MVHTTPFPYYYIPSSFLTSRIRLKQAPRSLFQIVHRRRILSSSMDSKRSSTFPLILLIIISSILCFQSRADGTGSVYFLDSSTPSYIQSRSSESKSMSISEVGAAISILLGFAPPSTLSSASSEKLNEVLVANPFNRPHAVFFLEINGFGDKQPELGNVFSKAVKSEVAMGDAEIQLSDEDELSVVSLNEPLPADMECTDKDLTSFASWLGGSYVNMAPEPLSGELTIPLANGAQLKLHMTKNADKEFTKSIISLIHNVQRAMQIHQDLAGGLPTPTELIKGRFDGLKALQEHYGTNDIVQKCAELLLTSVSKIYDSLQTTYKGQIVGVVVFNGSPAKESDTVLALNFTKQASPRWLEEEQGSHDAALIAETLLVRRTLAWITGIILIIATLMGVWFLMYMPLTRDTLLYSNVKLD